MVLLKDDREGSQNNQSSNVVKSPSSMAATFPDCGRHRLPSRWTLGVALARSRGDGVLLGGGGVLVRVVLVTFVIMVVVSLIVDSLNSVTPSKATSRMTSARPP